MGHNSTVPIRIDEKYLQIIPKFGKCRPPCEGRGKWIMHYGMLLLGPTLMMITTQVRHHTQLDLSTCRVCSVKHMMIIRQDSPRLRYVPYPLYVRGLGLCFFIVRWSVICCQHSCFMASPKTHCPKSISVTILTSNNWEDTRRIWCLSYPSGGAPLIPGRYVSW